MRPKILNPEIFGHYLPLYIDGNNLYASKGLNLYRSSDSGHTFTKVASYPADVITRIASGIKLLARIGRLGFQTMQVLQDGTIVAVIKGAIIRKSPESDKFSITFKIERGSRPLNICLSSSGLIYFGEYFGNPERESVNIYRSVNGQVWEVAYTFPPGSIRHVHGIFPDSIRNGLWVLTGDENHESGLWFTGDDFTNLSKQAGGSQKARALSVFPVKGGLIVPMDSPDEVNFIHYLDLKTGEFEALQKLPGSAFHSFRENELMIISTAVEPSEVNKADYTSIYASKNGKKWKCIAQIKKDLFPLKMKKYFRYPEIIFPSGSSSMRYIFAYGRGVRKYDGCLFAWEKTKLLDFLHNDD